MNNLHPNIKYLNTIPCTSNTENVNYINNCIEYYCLQLNETGNFDYADKIELLLFDYYKTHNHYNNPIYLKSMWLREGNNLVCTLYGSYTLETIINDVKVCIEQVTNYPLEYEVKFIITVEKPVDFCIIFRIPPWAKSLSYGNKKSISLDKTWKRTEEFTLAFKPILKVI